ncbi:MAG: ThiF family adenylyltransferase [Promethearchaeota archaeon]
MSTTEQLNQAWFELWRKNKFSQASIVVVGAGAIGNNVILGLAGFGVGKITIIDGDIIELHNLNRQIAFTEEDASENRYKSDVLADKVRVISPEIQVHSIKEYITPENVEKLVGTPDVIVEGVDNVLCRVILSRYALIKNIPLVHSATSHLGGEIGVITRNTACIECFYTSMIQRSCADNPVPAVVYSNMVIGALVVENVRILLQPLNETEKPITPLLYYEVERPDRFWKVELKRKPECVCNKILKEVGEKND